MKQVLQDLQRIGKYPVGPTIWGRFSSADINPHFSVAAARTGFDHKYPIAYDGLQQKSRHVIEVNNHKQAGANLGKMQERIRAKGRR